MSWDPFQREVLAELGHVVYRTAGHEAVADASPAIAAGTAAASSGDAALLARLARAAGVPVDALPAAWHDPQALSRLRASGAAKRALWPRLRTLRNRPQ
ncbi:MAG: hypothetical protein V4704_09090 [Pseudomonadota bacterium]